MPVDKVNFGGRLRVEQAWAAINRESLQAELNTQLKKYPFDKYRTSMWGVWFDETCAKYKAIFTRWTEPNA